MLLECNCRWHITWWHFSLLSFSWKEFQNKSLSQRHLWEQRGRRWPSLPDFAVSLAPVSLTSCLPEHISRQTVTYSGRKEVSVDPCLSLWKNINGTVFTDNSDSTFFRNPLFFCPTRGFRTAEWESHNSQITLLERCPGTWPVAMGPLSTGATSLDSLVACHMAGWGQTRLPTCVIWKLCS